MPLQFQTVEEPSFGRGIDARSAENQIRDGFVRDLVNADIVEGRIRKRKGHADFAGKVPVRVSSFRQTVSPVQRLYLRFDSSVDLSRLTGSPLLIYGRSSNINDAGSFSTTDDLAKYYPTWFTNITKILAANTTGTITSPVSEHNIQTSDIFTGLAGKPATATNLTNYSFLSDTAIDSLNYDIDVTYTNSTANDVETYLFYSNGSPIVGEIFVKDNITGAPSVTITQGTHGLTSTNLRYTFFKQDGSSWVKVIPDEFSINQTTGDVTITLVDGDTSPTPDIYKIILATVPQNQTVDTNLGSVTSQIPFAFTGETSFTGAIITNVDQPYLFYTIYEKSGSLLNEIMPDEVWYDDVNKQLELRFRNESSGKNIVVHYDYGTIRANELYVSATGLSVTNSDPTPQLSVYGLDHSTIYGSEKEVNRRGWVTHLDSYRSPSTTHMVAGLGGNLFAALRPDQMYSRDGITALPMKAAMPTYSPRLNARVANTWPLGTPNIGPAFVALGGTPNRKRETIAFTGGDLGWATIYQAVYLAAPYPLPNRVTYYLRTPNKNISGSGFISDAISTVAGKEDYVTITGMGHTRHNGTFKIVDTSSTLNTDYITLTVINPNIDSSDYDDDSCAGLGGVFTDQIELAVSSPFIADDILLSSAWGGTVNPEVVSVSGTTIVVGDLYSLIELSPGLTIAGRRTSATIPLRENNTATVNNLVVGDTLVCSDFDRPLQILYINVAPDNAGNLQPAPDTITVDESFTWEDNISLPTTLSVAGRWISAEVPAPVGIDYSLIPKTTVQHLSANPYDDQPFLRSAMVQNNMYLTNGNDEVYKYDGYNFYRAGMIPWQPGLFLTTEETASGGIPLAAAVANDGGGGSVLELVGSRIKIDKTQGEFFSVNDLVIIRDGTVSPTIDHYLTIKSRELETAGNHYYITFKEPLPFTSLGSGATVKMITTYQARYYFRLNIKDTNGVTTASAVTGAEDFVAVIAPTTPVQYKINLRLVGLPVWDQYDYSNKNVEVEVYRTLWTTVAVGEVPVFYRLPVTKIATFAGPDGYLDIVDTYSNNTLSLTDFVVGSLSPDTIPAAWDEPPKARYTTTAGNRLVLANLTNWPTLDISYLSSTTIQSAFDGQKITFRKDARNTTLSPVTDMTNFITYELRNTGGTSVSAITPTAGQFTFTTIPSRAIVSGDWVYLYFTTSGGHPLSICGWWQVSAATAYVSGSPVTCTIKCSGTLVAPVLGTHPVSALFATTAKDVPININSDQNMGMFNGQTTNFSAPIARIIRRVGMAINATMRVVDTTLLAYSSFTPWLIARSESDTQSRLLVTQPRAEVLLPAVSISTVANVSAYVNGSAVKTGTQIIPAAVTRYPSRLAVSYENYPEIFDNLWTVNTDGSASVIDVNSADGQEITGVIPFFGESAFGASLQSGVLVVFKQNSIYLVDLAAKASGQNAVQRLETQGLGCTAPYSIAPTKDGIAFANDSGIYVLRRNQRIEYLGRFVERLWQGSVRKDFLNIVQGHHYGVGRQYKLSVPVRGEGSAFYAANSQVYVYNHTGEEADSLGGWGRYTDIAATGWANLFQDAFYANVNGSILRLRNLDEEYDYRDGNEAIEAVLETRATSFGNTAIRKIASHVTVHYRSGQNSDSTTVETSADLNKEYQPSTSFRVVTSPSISDGLGTVAGQDIVSIMHTIGRRRCIYIAIKITNNGINDNVEIAGISYTVSALSGAGVKQAAETE